MGINNTVRKHKQMRIIRVFSRPKDCTKQTEIAEFSRRDVDLAAAFYNSHKSDRDYKSVWWESVDSTCWHRCEKCGNPIHDETHGKS